MKLTPRQVTLSMWAHGRNRKVVLEVPGQFFVEEMPRGWTMGIGPPVAIPLWRPSSAATFLETPGPGDDVRQVMYVDAKTALVDERARYVLWAEDPEKHIKRTGPGRGGGEAEPAGEAPPVVVVRVPVLPVLAPVEQPAAEAAVMHLVRRWVGRQEMHGPVVYCRRPPDRLIVTNCPSLMTCPDCHRIWLVEPSN